jgi:hypothetical protein
MKQDTRSKRREGDLTIIVIAAAGDNNIYPEQF